MDRSAVRLSDPPLPWGVRRPMGQEPTSRLRPRWRYAWIWAAIWLAYLVQPYQRAWSVADPERRWTGLLVLTLFSLTFVGTFATLPPILRAGGGTVIRYLPTPIMAILGVAIVALLGESELPLFVYVAVLAMFTLPGRLGPLVVVGLVAGTSLAQWLVPGWTQDYSVQFQIFIGGAAMWGVVQIIMRNRELDAAREEIGRLAVAEERNRFARDLHDILGHSLTVLAVKAELAGRLVRLDPDRAEAEITDVERLSRSALAEVRTAVAGYRDVSLAAELANARTALSAAGIDADLPTAIDSVPADRRELFGWVVREGVTNVVRHSGAAHCWVRLTTNSVGSAITIADDGTPSPVSEEGHGLIGLRERAEAVGGTIHIGRSAAGFELTVRA